MLLVVDFFLCTELKVSGERQRTWWWQWLLYRVVYEKGTVDIGDTTDHISDHALGDIEADTGCDNSEDKNGFSLSSVGRTLLYTM